MQDYREQSLNECIPKALNNIRKRKEKEAEISKLLAFNPSNTLNTTTTSKTKKKTKQKQKKKKKKALVLDIDNTLIYVRHFMDEMRVDDRVTLGPQQARVIQLNYLLELELSESRTMAAHDYVITSPLQVTYMQYAQTYTYTYTYTLCMYLL